ncbi:hypothetical protein PAPYR_4528 [Paratrimastix pyriformis]|uniref:Uncharacterized protein n=1 Tax=Paratrimastix pyriformis TaxID=342808 RepID=A0ABQ8UJT0_9EUKA|nr:hypothetical protein PAPYR_4528 [Paratrimastix pyriformis]
MDHLAHFDDQPVTESRNGIHFHVSVCFTKLDGFLALFPDGGKFGRRTGEESSIIFSIKHGQNATTSPQAQVTPVVRKRPGGPGRENYWVRRDLPTGFDSDDDHFQAATAHMTNEVCLPAWPFSPLPAMERPSPRFCSAFTGIEHRALLTDAVLRGIHPCHVLICALVGVLIRRLEFNHRKTIPRLPRASHSAVSSPAAPECALVGIFVLHRVGPSGVSALSLFDAHVPQKLKKCQIRQKSFTKRHKVGPYWFRWSGPTVRSLVTDLECAMWAGFCETEEISDNVADAKICSSKSRCKCHARFIRQLVGTPRVNVYNPLDIETLRCASVSQSRVNAAS